MVTLTAVQSATNDALDDIESSMPYVARIRLEGVAALLFHRWSDDAVEAKSKAVKGSKAKKSDNVESYVWRNADGDICLPGEYLRQSVIMAAKFRQDPRSPRKSAMDLFKAGVVSVTDLASLGVKDWDYLVRRRAVVQRSAITRMRPAMLAGWSVDVDLQVLLPEYITPHMLHAVLVDAGRLVGVGDFRPTYGRFQVTRFEAK
jgi:hypothetical protein